MPETHPFDLTGLGRLPGRLTAAQTAAVLGVQPEDITILIRAKLLRPLGSPPTNGPKFFAAVCVEALARDERWLARASDAITKHHWERNHDE